LMKNPCLQGIPFTSSKTSCSARIARTTHTRLAGQRHAFLHCTIRKIPPWRAAAKRGR
jgi:hypothetical protein